MDGLRTWVEVDMDALAHNYAVLRRKVRDRVPIAAVVKSNAYGHGLVETARALNAAGVRHFCVDSFVEAEKLLDVARLDCDLLLVLGHTLPDFYERAAALHASLTVSGMTDLKHLTEARNRLKRCPHPLPVHMKIDTGMHRQGFSLAEFPEACKILKTLVSNNTIWIDGIYTHLAAAFKPQFEPETEQQIRRFDGALAILAESGFAIPEYVHAAATGGLWAHSPSHYSLVRSGIGFYGYWPDRESPYFPSGGILRPVLSWKTVITDIKHYAKDERIGYDFSETLKRDSRVAILPVGYFHAGYYFHLSRRGYVLVRGKRAKILGRVSMDMMTVDVTDIPEAEPEDVVTLIGQDGTMCIGAHDLAEQTKLSPYAVLTCINDRIRRIPTSASQS